MKYDYNTQEQERYIITYYTVINGKGRNLALQSYDEEIKPELEKMFLNMANSIHFEIQEKPSGS